MDLKALFQRLRAPKKMGTAPAVFRPSVKVGRYALEFTNIEGSPVYPLTGSFAIGSETGDLVIEDPTLSPRHATFAAQNDVLTVMDNGSAQGTHLNGTALPSGRAVILQVGDELSLGEVTVKVLMQEISQAEVEAEEPEVLEEPVPVAEVEELAEAPTFVEEEEASSESKTQQLVNPLDMGEKLKGHLGKMREQTHKDKKSKRGSMGGGRVLAANTLPRVFGILLDIGWTLILWEVFSPFLEFRWATALPVVWMQENILPLFESLITQLGHQAMYETGMKAFLREIRPFEDQWFLSHQAGLFLLLRMGSTLLLGESLGDWMVGIRAEGSILWKRVGGLIREVIGFVTAPTIVADLPALLSRRTLKELLTFTRLYTSSQGTTIISILLFVPLTLVLWLLAPMVEGFEFPEVITITQAKLTKAKTAGEEGDGVTMQISSRWFGATFEVAPAKWWVLPRFQWSQEGGKRALRPMLEFNHESGVVIPLSLAKKFNWVDLLNPILAHNPLAQNSYKTLWKYLQSAHLRQGTVLKHDFTATEDAQFAAELQLLIQTAFNLGPETLIDHMQEFGPFIKGYVDFKRTLQQLVQAKSNGNWSFQNAGKDTLLVYESADAKPYDLLIPMTAGPGRIMRVDYVNSAQRGKVSSLGMRELWSKAHWKMSGVLASGGLIETIDVINSLVAGKSGSEMDVSLERVFGAFFERAGVLVGEPVESPWRVAFLRSLKDVVSVLSELEHAKEATPSESVSKLHERLSEVAIQLEAGNKTFFGVL